MSGRSSLHTDVRELLYPFRSFEALSLHLEAGGDEQDLELPAGATGFTDGEWVLAKIVVGADTTSIAACMVDRGDGLRLAFEDRDWQRLWQFANSVDPPTIPPPSQPPPAVAVESAALIRILVVDDEVDTQQVLKALLQAVGYVVGTVGSAEEAFDVLRKDHADLVVLDWNLPGMSGIEFCQRLRRDPPFSRLPVVFVTAHTSSKDLVAAFEAGADDFVRKPFRAPELKARILGLVRRSKMAAYRQSR
jgi:two-component system phosphate regulon response regulator PhoB